LKNNRVIKAKFYLREGGILEGTLYIKYEDSDDVLTIGKITNLMGTIDFKTDEDYEIPSIFIDPQKEYTIELENVKWSPYQYYTLLGFEFFGSELMADRLQRRKHKKKRINKKWKDLYGFVEVPQKGFYQVGNKLVAHPKTISKMKEILMK
jgi:hypothetical protein